MTDYRPEISRKLRDAKGLDHVWLTWPNPPQRLKVKAASASTASNGSMVIFVLGRRFGLGQFIDKDGRRVAAPTYADDKPVRLQSVYVHGDEVRAEVLEAHPLAPDPSCGRCEHYAEGACHHPSKDSPTVSDPASRPRWCPGFVVRSAR